MRKWLYLSLCVAFFAIGAYAWRLQARALQAGSAPVQLSTETGASVGAAQPRVRHEEESADKEISFQTSNSVLLVVAGENVFKEDIEWEYHLLVDGVFERESMTPIPDLGQRYHDELQSLRKALIASIVERKVLVAFVRQDRSFDAQDPARFGSCLSEWQKTVESGHEAFRSREGRERLKVRLCERSLLSQYLEQRVVADLAIEDGKVIEYYKNHASEFRRPERVRIRQIVLPNEDLAKRVRHQVNPMNFAAMARQHSISPDAEKGGEIGPFVQGILPSVFDVAFHMKKNEISGILKSPYGYHIVMLTDKLTATELGLDQVRSQVVTTLRKKLEVEKYGEWVEKALASVHVTTPTAVW